METKILIVDDSIDFTTTLADIIKSFGFAADYVNSPNEAILYLEKNHSNVGLILLDIEFGFGEKINGLDLLDKFRQLYISIPVVMISGKGTIETAVKATKLGAVNFIEKNIITKEKIRGIIDSTISQSKSRGEDTEIQRFLAMNGIIGKSKAITEVGDNIVRYGRTDLNILITGETGTGKKLVANAIHSISRRMKGNFVTVDIPNIPRETFQSELFGYVKNPFTGFSENKLGLFHQADKGILFLDEIGELSLELQSSLLTPIEEKRIRKIGESTSESIDIRFIATTNRDLLGMIQADTFREQLYHRLRECEINIPSLASRAEDIPEIAIHFTTKHNLEFNEFKHFSSSAIEYLSEQRWHGNVRELSAVVRAVLQTTRKEEIEVSDIIKVTTSSIIPKNEFEQIHSISLEKTLKEDLAEVDKIKIEKTLAQNNGNVSKSAAILGVSRETLHNKIRKYEINTQQYRHKNS